MGASRSNERLGWPCWALKALIASALAAMRAARVSRSDLDEEEDEDEDMVMEALGVLVLVLVLVLV